jgi:hypothetical protein
MVIAGELNAEDTRPLVSNVLSINSRTSCSDGCRGHLQIRGGSLDPMGPFACYICRRSWLTTQYQVGRWSSWLMEKRTELYAL